MKKSKTRWIIAEADESTCEKLSKELMIDPLLARLLVIRGIDTVDRAREFLNPTMDRLHNPFLLPDMEESVKRIRTACASGERIRIYGDYDCDGVSSTALLYDCLKDFTTLVDYYIPNRFTEGYGLNSGAVEKAKEEDISLIITVDTGISAVEQVDLANQFGIDVIITDHHEPPEILPKAYSIINPKRHDCEYPFPLLAGVGVAFKLAHALTGSWKPQWLQWAAIGTIADLVPLKGENRILAKAGLAQMNEEPSIGVKALAEASGLNGKMLSAGHIGFSLGPRINASGRLDSASISVKLLLSENETRAATIAAHLSACNEERQQLVKQMIDEAIEQVEAEPEGNRHCIVVGHSSWNAGVIGIVASKLVEKYYRPAIVFSFDNEKGIAKGSARSISGLHLYESLSDCDDLLSQYGGHEMAAGMSMPITNFDSFKQRINEVAHNALSEEDYIPKTIIDAVLPLEDVTVQRADMLDMLAPYGMGNRSPRFMVRDINLVDKRHMGRDEEHVKLVLEHNNRRMNALAFRQKEEMKDVSLMSTPSIVGEITVNEWNGASEPQIIIQDIMVDHVQLHDKRNRIATILNDWNENQSPLLLFFTDEAKQKFLSGYAKEKNRINNYVRLWNEEESLDDLSVTRHLFILEVPKSQETMKRCLECFPSLEHITLCWTKEWENEKKYYADRDVFKRLYSHLYASNGKQTQVQLETWARSHAISRTMLDTALAVFEELNMIEMTDSVIKLVEKPIKRELQESRAFREAYKWSQLAAEWLQIGEKPLHEEMKRLLKAK